MTSDSQGARGNHLSDAEPALPEGGGQPTDQQNWRQCPAGEGGTAPQELSLSAHISLSKPPRRGGPSPSPGLSWACLSKPSLCPTFPGSQSRQNKPRSQPGFQGLQDLPEQHPHPEPRQLQSSHCSSDVQCNADHWAFAHATPPVQIPSVLPTPCPCPTPISKPAPGFLRTYGGQLMFPQTTPPHLAWLRHPSLNSPAPCSCPPDFTYLGVYLLPPMPVVP